MVFFFLHWMHTDFGHLSCSIDHPTHVQHATPQWCHVSHLQCSQENTMLGWKFSTLVKLRDQKMHDKCLACADNGAEFVVPTLKSCVLHRFSNLSAIKLGGPLHTDVYSVHLVVPWHFGVSRLGDHGAEWSGAMQAVYAFGLYHVGTTCCSMVRANQGQLHSCLAFQMPQMILHCCILSFFYSRASYFKYLWFQFLQAVTCNRWFSVSFDGTAQTLSQHTVCRVYLIVAPMPFSRCLQGVLNVCNGSEQQANNMLT
mmetsp:Transcript_54211/g.90354  ORF Transcript_54211/g.90354 Transcript_54211/m.90354 type:complete len:256 (+) Transcript_54211:850-1617(+)